VQGRKGREGERREGERREGEALLVMWPTKLSALNPPLGGCVPGIPGGVDASAHT